MMDIKFSNYKDMLFKEPSPFCNGMYCCENKTHDSNDSKWKECDEDYNDAMKQVRNPTQQMIDESEYLYNSIMGVYNVVGV